MTYESLGYAGIYSIHRHVVAIVGSPSEGKLAEVACSHHHSADAVCHVHKNLCALSSLSVLVGDVVVCDVVVDVEEMLCDTLCYGYFLHSDTERCHKTNGIVVCAVGGSKSWHGDAVDSLAVETKIVEGTYAYEKGESGVESAADAHNDVFAVGMMKTLRES